MTTLFLKRLLFNILSLVFIELPLQLAGMILLLLYLPFFRRKITPENPASLKLPFILRWFDIVDMYVGRDTSTYQRIAGSDFLTHYSFIAIRNPLNYFHYKYLGFQFTGKESYDILKSSVDKDIGDTPGCTEGFKNIELSTGYYEYLYVKKIGSKACFYFRMGWKIKNIENPPGSYCQKVFTISYRSYSGV